MTSRQLLATPKRSASVAPRPMATIISKSVAVTSRLITSSMSIARDLSIRLRHETSSCERRLIVVFVLILAFGQLDFFPRRFLVRNKLKEMDNGVQARPAFLVRADDVPGRFLGVGRVQHFIAGAGIGIPSG